MVTASQLELNVLLIPQGLEDSSVGYTAQCLEYDIATQAKGIREAVYELYRAIYSTLLLVEQGQQPMEDLVEAPEEYRKRFADAIEIELSDFSANVKLELERSGSLLSAGGHPVFSHVRIAERAVQ